MTDMRAARLVEPGTPLQIHQLAVPEPGPGEVVVQVHACGLCGTDIHLAIDGDLPVAHTPITLGHEAAGVVARVGAAVSTAREGDRVAMFPAASCGHCRFCASGRESLCDSSQVYGMVRDGALADYVLASARSLIALPKDVPFDIGAVVTDGVATPFHALRSRGGLQAGEAVGIFGCGGLGTHAVQLARLMGAACIVAIDVDANALDRALQLGADFAVDARQEDVVRAVRKHVGRAGLDLTLEFVGRAETVEQAVRCLGKAGRCVAVGVGMARPTMPPLARFVGKEQALLGSFGMDRGDIEDLYQLLAAGRLDLSKSISARYGLDQADLALNHLASKTGGVVRVIVEPQAER